jgi:hypothetical protein
MYSAADYVEMLTIYGECGNQVNPHALFSRAFQQRFYRVILKVVLVFWSRAAGFMWDSEGMFKKFYAKK